MFTENVRPAGRKALFLFMHAVAVAGIAGAQGYTVTTLVTDRTVRPDGLGKFSPLNPSVDGDFVVFNQGDVCATCATPDSLWTANVATGDLRKVVSTGTAVPGGTGNFSRIDSGAIARGGTVVFI